MKRIVGFGDSFVFGSELADNADGTKSWVAQCAKRLKIDYYTCAVPGCGNDNIARQIYSWFANNDSADTLAVINWTWITRWDLYFMDQQNWITLRPEAAQAQLNNPKDIDINQRLVEFYQTWGTSLLWNKIRNLQIIAAAQAYLAHKNVLAIQTYMEYDLFKTDSHAPDYVKELQKLVEPHMSSFEGLNFVDWSRSQNFEITQENHPLEPAHATACDLWTPIYQQALNL